MKQPVTIEIAGTKFRMSTDAEPAHLERLAQLVNARIAEYGPKALRSTSSVQLLAVVALGLAEDLELSEQRRKNLERATRKAVGTAIELLDRNLAEHARSGTAPRE